MGLYTGDAVTAEWLDDPKGCYVGRGMIWIEMTNTTVVFKSDLVSQLTQFVKVPAAEFRNLAIHGMTTISLKNRHLEASREAFRAALPIAPAADYIADIRVVDHQPLTSAMATRLIDQLSRAAAFTAPAADNSAYRFVYVVERQVIATDGGCLFLGRLPGCPNQRMVFTRAAASDLSRLWGRSLPTRAMYSAHSLLLKDLEHASATRCVDAPVPTVLYRKLRTACFVDASPLIETAALKSAVACLRLAAVGAHVDVRVALERDQCTLTTRMGSIVVPTVTECRGAPRKVTVTLGRLERGLERMSTEHVQLGHLSGLSINLALATRDADVLIAMAAHKEGPHE